MTIEVPRDSIKLAGGQTKTFEVKLSANADLDAEHA